MEEPAPAADKQPRGMRWFFCACCGAPPGERKPRERRPKRERKPKRERRRHRHRAGGAATPIKTLSNMTARTDAGQASILSDEDWHDVVHDAFSVVDDGHSPCSIPASPRGSVDSPSRRDSAGGRRGASGEAGSPTGGGGGGGGDGGSSASGSYSSGYEDEDEEGSSTFSEGGPGIAGRLVSCLAMMRHDVSLTGDEPAGPSPKGVAVGRGPRPPAGVTLPRRQPTDAPDQSRCCWDEVDATTYQIRGVEYMRTRVKVSSSKAIYRLAAVDVFRTDAKAFHVARTVSLPAARDPVMVGDAALPPLLVFNVQLPQYPAAFFGGSDGPGQSVVYYFVLPDDFDPARFENQAALGLLARFVANGREPDGSSTRERLKMIVRCCNSEEWAAAAPLTTTEYKLLVNYNEKPVLTRPQQHFFVGPNYLEVDMDVHSYAYLARKAFNSFHSRLKSVVWENAFVLQGNAAEELPEQVLGCGRIYRTDLEEARPLADFQPPGASALTSRAPSALATPAGPSGGGGGGGGVRAHPLAADAIAAVAAAEATAAQLAVAAEAGARAAAAAGPVAVAAQAGG